MTNVARARPFLPGLSAERPAYSPTRGDEMLDVVPRLPIHGSRCRPVPLLDPPPRRLRESERRLILSALAARPPCLPTDWPDLTPLLDRGLAGDRGPA